MIVCQPRHPPYSGIVLLRGDVARMSGPTAISRPFFMGQVIAQLAAYVVRGNAIA